MVKGRLVGRKVLVAVGRPDRALVSWSMIDSPTPPLIPALESTSAAEEAMSETVGALAVGTAVGTSSEITDSKTLDGSAVFDPMISERALDSMTGERLVGADVSLPSSSDTREETTLVGIAEFERIDVTSEDRADGSMGACVALLPMVDVPTFAMLVTLSAREEATSEGMAVLDRMLLNREFTSELLDRVGSASAVAVAEVEPKKAEVN